MTSDQVHVYESLCSLARAVEIESLALLSPSKLGFCYFRTHHPLAANLAGNLRRDGKKKKKLKLSIAPEVHKDTGVPRGTCDKVAGPPCQTVLENQSVIAEDPPPPNPATPTPKNEWRQSG